MKVVSSQWSVVSKSVFCFGLSATLFALCFSVEAQQPKKIPRIGFLSAASPSSISVRIEAFRQGLRELGYVEGKNIAIDYRYAEGKVDRLSGLAAELVRLKVDVIVTGGPAVTRPAKEATTTIPIVMGFDDDPVGSGFIVSLGRPGGNITGLSTLSPELSGKQLELLKEVVPKLSRVAVLGISSNPANAQALRETELAAGELRVQLQYLEVRSPDDIETTFQAASKGRAEAILALTNPVPHFSANTACRTCNKEPAPGDIRRARICGSWWAYVLQREHYRLVPAGRYLRGQNPQRLKARRSPRRAADEVRACDQSEDGQADRPDDSAERVGASGQGNQVILD